MKKPVLEPGREGGADSASPPGGRDGEELGPCPIPGDASTRQSDEGSFGESNHHDRSVVDFRDELIDLDRGAVGELTDLLEQTNRGADVGGLKVADLERHISPYTGNPEVRRGVLRTAVSRSEDE